MSLKDRFKDLFARAKEVQNEIPLNMPLRFDHLSKALPVPGPYKNRKKGDGMEMFSIEPYKPGDNLRRVSRRYSEKDRQQRTMVVHKEQEVRHHYFMWQDNSPSMDYKSDKTAYSPREIVEGLITGLSNHLGTSHAKVGLLETGQSTQGGTSGDWIADRLVDDEDPHDVPRIQSRLARDSSALLFSDGLWDLDQENPPIVAELDYLDSLGINGWLVIVLDPTSVDFESKDRLFMGSEGEESWKLDHVSAKDYHRVLLDHIDKLQALADEYNFELIVHRTDEPWQHVVDALYDMGPMRPKRWPERPDERPDTRKDAPTTTRAPKP